MKLFSSTNYVVALAAFIFSCTARQEAPDLILLNGKVWTGQDELSFEQALAIKANKIMAVGKSDMIAPLADDQTQVIDVGGRLVSAGFNDAHIHFLSGSLSLTEVDLNGTTSPDEIAKRVAEYRLQNPTKEWIRGRGWQYTSFEAGFPDHHSLNAISNEVPVFLVAYDGHSGWANEKALSIAGISRHTAYSGFGEIVRDKNGNPTGTLRESAMRLVTDFMPKPTRAEKLTAIKKGLQLAASLGITSLQNADGSLEDLSIYTELLRRGELTARYAAAFSASEKTSDNDIGLYTKAKDSIGPAHPMIRADAIKFRIDGVIESHTAFMLQPYADLKANDPLAFGQRDISKDKYERLAAAFDKNGFRLYTHAIGDRAVREALDAYEYAASQNGVRDSRHRIEHIETISPDDLPRFAKLAVLPSMEPIHADPGTIAVWEKAIGKTRLPFSFNWLEMLKNNARLVFSSDWPACIDINPIRGLHVAVNRRTPEGYPKNGWLHEQKISVVKALQAYTSAGAYSSFEENLKGRIKEGQLADVIVFSQDLFTIDPMKIHETGVVLTVFDGKVIYNKLDQTKQ